MNFYPFHIGDYISHTSHLSDAEDLAYRRLIDLYYQSEAAFPHDLAMLARKVKSNSETVDLLLNEFFEFIDNEWHNTRADKEIAKYHAMQDGGRKGAAIRWAKGSDSPPNAKPMPTKNQEPLTKNHIKIIEAPAGVSLEVWNDFVLQRKKSKAVISENVIKTIAKEAEKANWTLEQALAECAARGWRGFKAEWVAEQAAKQKKNALVTNEQIEEAYRTELGKDPKLARFNSYYEMKDFIIKHREKGARNV
jgi:uncharacterized protein YdaU (DUF1376 family)